MAGRVPGATNLRFDFPLELLQVYVRKRPHMDYFMNKVSQWFEIIVFTASQKVLTIALRATLCQQQLVVAFAASDCVPCHCIAPLPLPFEGVSGLRRQVAEHH